MNAKPTENVCLFEQKGKLKFHSTLMARLVFLIAVASFAQIAIPNNTRINCIAWNKDQGYIAVGGDDGLVKVLKLDQPNVNNVNPVQSGNLCMNQTLEGHKAAVNVVTWNDSQQKLTTSDCDGVIMVWMLYKVQLTTIF